MSTEIHLKDCKILVTGCGGMLGSELLPKLLKRCNDVVATDKIASTGQQVLDIRDSKCLRETFLHQRPTIIMHLAAETDLEFCEANQSTAWQVNSEATKELSQLSVDNDALMVYISTVGVFDGEKMEPYTEDDIPNPVNIYGKSKFSGEVHVRKLCRRHLIVRAGWMMGGGPGVDHKFIGKVMARLNSGSKLIQAVDDRKGSPTHAGDFSDNLLDLIELGQTGTYHMTCTGGGTRYDVAKEMVRILGRNDVEVVPVDSTFFQETYPAPRPKSEVMENALLNTIGMNRMRPWRDALGDYLGRFVKRGM